MDASMTAPLLGLRVLVVEDETLVSMMLVEMLEELGCSVAAAALSLEDALYCLEHVPVDAAVLDINLAGTTSYAIAAALARRGTPFIFATGYDDRLLIESDWNNVPRILKPFVESELAKALSVAVGARLSEQTPLAVTKASDAA
jgi:CheY-like chemotaxis protein